MKKLMFAGLAIAAALTACNSGNNIVTLNGTTDLADGEVLILSYRLDADSTVTDTIAVAGGQFSHTINLDHPRQAVIFNGAPSRGNYRMRNFYLQPGTTTFVLEGDNYTGAEVKGSSLTYEMDSINTVNASIYDQMQALYARASEVQDDSVATAALMAEYKGFNEQLQNVKTDFIKTHPSSYVSADLLPALQGSLELDQLKELYNGLSPEVQAAAEPTGKYIAALESLTPGSPAPAIAGKDQNGNEVSLESLKGKVVLLDFWATWCGPCRASLPHVKELWEKYNGKGMQVLAVSLDRDADAWKEFIANSGMGMENYANIIDEGGANADAYAIQFIPSKFIIDREGNFLGRFDNEEELNAKLAELLGE
ncbi:MAG: AhpC/TSA family protein [Duncaniella sp.]|nr:AhpC/TSA family protein [Duncaniella sp.]